MRKPTLIWTGTALIVVALTALAIAAPSARPRPVSTTSPAAASADARPRSIVLIVNDTMRRDYVGLVGNAARTPHFDDFARSNLWFDQGPV